MKKKPLWKIKWFGTTLKYLTVSATCFIWVFNNFVQNSMWMNTFAANEVVGSLKTEKKLHL